MDDFLSWSHDAPADAFDLQRPADLENLWAVYGGARPELFAEILSHAERVQARGVLVEYRYIDADYRSEHSRFYSTTFRRYPSVAHRLHFFREVLGDDALDGSKATDFSRFGYIGYAVIRPVDASPIGRTMLPPEQEMVGRVSCAARDSVNVFGSPLSVLAAPFMAQDAQLGVCVHVTAWICSYYHHLRFGGTRHLPSDIAGYTPVERGGRLVPSSSLTVSQLVAILERTGLPPVVYDLARLPPRESTERVICRYLNSGLPVIVAGGGHTFVLVGYRTVRQEGRDSVQFIRQDDLEGPYGLVETTALDRYRPWEYLVIPLPAKVYMSGERAESLGRTKICDALDASPVAGSDDLRGRIDRGELNFRTSVHLSNEFKAKVASRPEEIASAYQWLQLSRWVWVVELVDPEKWDAGDPAVIAEAVIDATGHAEDSQALAWRIPGALHCAVPDFSKVGTRDLDPVGLLPSVVNLDTSVVLIPSGV
jgi:hypothetical protein